MKVILVADVKNVGKKGEVVDVSEGYATNFLIKKRLAILQNKANLNDLNKQKEEAKKLDIAKRQEAMDLKNKLQTIVVVYKENAGLEGRLHSAITAKMIEEKLEKEFSIKVDKKNFKNFMPIKAIGKATIEVVLYKDIVGKINVEIKEN
jgi:large subunit ribosomal protein L9